eukprot:8156569-Alexandrium_andersonii.AAC.1
MPNMPNRFRRSELEPRGPRNRPSPKLPRDSEAAHESGAWGGSDAAKSLQAARCRLEAAKNGFKCSGSGLERCGPFPWTLRGAPEARGWIRAKSVEVMLPPC